MSIKKMSSHGILKDATFWGPGAWRFLHVLSLTYNDTNFEDVSKFLSLFIKLLPCDQCAQHSSDFMTDWSNKYNQRLLVENKSQLENFVNELHNHANRFSSKSISYVDLNTSKDMMLQSYKNFHLNNIISTDIGLWILVAIFTCIIVCILWKLSVFWRCYQKSF